MIWKIGRKKRLQLYLSRLIVSRAAVTRVRDPCQRFPPPDGRSNVAQKVEIGIGRTIFLSAREEFSSFRRWPRTSCDGVSHGQCYNY